jgi:hypothetical protein
MPAMKIPVPRPRIAREELAERLTQLAVPRGAYSLYGSGRQAQGHRMDQPPLGRWVVYFAERGARSSERFFDDERDACAEVFRRLQDEGDLPPDAVLM